MLASRPPRRRARVRDRKIRWRWSPLGYVWVGAGMAGVAGVAERGWRGMGSEDSGSAMVMGSVMVAVMVAIGVEFRVGEGRKLKLVALSINIYAGVGTKDLR